MKIRFAFILLVLVLSGCGSHGSRGGDCDRSGCTPLHVYLVSGEQAPPIAVPGGCAIRTALPTDTKNPDEHGADLRHIGESVYACLKGKAATGDGAPAGAFYHEQLWFRIEGACPVSSTPGYTYYGCFDDRCRSVNTVLGHIGPPSVCPTGTPMAQWTEACWTQFYTVLGHEVLHGWLGRWHA